MAVAAAASFVVSEINAATATVLFGPYSSPTSLTTPGRLPVLCATLTLSGSMLGNRSFTRWRSIRCTISELAVLDMASPRPTASRSRSMSIAEVVMRSTL